MSKILVSLIIIIVSTAPVFGLLAHHDYDWEGDNAKEILPPGPLESCYACHYGAMAALGYEKPRKKCEDCHTVNESTGRPNGPYEFYPIDSYMNFSLREDYSAPLVYSHLKVRNSTSPSTCLNYDEETGEGACHGVSDEFGEKLGGYFAFNQIQDRKMSKDYPYSRAFSKEFLPDSTDCLFCHFQARRKLARVWGDAPQVVPILHTQLAGAEGEIASGCTDCHLKKGNVLKNFHSEGIYVERTKGERGTQEIPIMAAALLLLLAIAILLFRKLLSKKRKVS